MLVRSLCFCLVVQVSIAQVVFTEVMFRPDTLSNYTEFIEIFNAGKAPIDLTGWQVGDSLDMDALVSREGTLTLLPGQFAIILDAGYFDHADIYDTLIPDSALVLTIEDASFGRYGLRNQPPLTLFLRDRENRLVDTYRYSSNNPPGYSDEKIDLLGPNTKQNWANSKQFRGTPGAVNSVTPKPVDLALTSIQFSDSLLWNTGVYSARFGVKNVGTTAITGFSIALYNLMPQPVLVASRDVPALVSPGDSVVVELTEIALPAGFLTLQGVVMVEGDADPSNDTLVFHIYVENADARLVFNEIMFEPRSGQSEWVEITNAGTAPVDVQNFLISDFKDTVNITPNTTVIMPGEFWVIARDTTIYALSAARERTILVPSLPTLNNDVDELSIFSPNGRLLDRVRYQKSWYGRNVEKGTSLERINPQLNSQNPDNWSASVDARGSTPTRQNSVFVVSPPSQAQLQILPNPFSPDGDGYEDFTLITVQMPSATGFISCRILDTRGRLIRTLARNQPGGSSAHFVWDGRTENGNIARIGMYIVLVDFYLSEKHEKQHLKGIVVLAKQK